MNIQKWLMTAFKINQLPQKHIVDRYFDSLKKLGISNDCMGLDFFIDETTVHAVRKFRLPDKYVVGVLGATYYTKQIPLNKWYEIISSIDLPIVLLGGSDVKEIGDQLLSKYPQQILNLAGQLSIVQSAEVIRHSTMVITPDTGLMHIAAALQKHIHIIWGNTIPEFGMYPYFGNQAGVFKSHEVLGLTCRPCTKLGYPSCPKQHFHCMQKHVFDKKTLEI